MKRVIVPTINNFGPIQTKDGNTIAGNTISKDNLVFKDALKNEISTTDADFLTTYRDWETDRKSTRLNSSHITRSRMPSSA